jgi:hypothetical protein
MATTGAVSPTTVDQITGSDRTWSSIEEAITQDDTPAEVTVTEDEHSKWLEFGGFDFSSVPDGATVDGCKVVARVACGYTGSGFPTGSGTCNLECQLVLAGTPDGDVKASSALTLLSYVTRTHGADDDDWGVLTGAAQVKHADFGVRLRVDGDGISGRLNGNVDLDALTCEIVYTAPPSGGGGGGVGGRRFVLTGDAGDRRPGGIHGR